MSPGGTRLVEAERFARLLLDSTGEGLYGIDLEGRCIFANRRAVELLGYDDERELLGQRMHRLVHHTRADGSPYPEAECRIYEAHRDGHGVARDDEWLFRRDGSSFPVEYRSHPIEQDGEVVGSVLTFVDITDRRRAEAELERGRALQRVAGSVARLGGWSLDVATSEVRWSEEIYEILDHPREGEPDLVDALALYREEDRPRVEAALEACAARGEPFDLEAELESFAGRALVVRIIGEPVHDESGAVVHVTGALQDVTLFRESTRQIRTLAKRLTTTLESITDALFTVDRDWVVTYVNREAERLLRRTREELLGRRFWAEFPDIIGTEAETAYRRAMTEDVTTVLEDFHYPPLGGWFEIHAYPSEQGLAVYFRDVTEQHRAREVLREREQQLAQQAELLDKARDAILVSDLDHRITYFNRSAELLYGYSAEEALGRSVRDLLYGDPAEFDRATAELLEHDEWAGELGHVAGDGTRLLIEARWTLVRDDDGTAQSVLAINSDVTERKRVEQQLLRAQRLESLGTLAGGIAHDLNNVLAPILLSVQTLQLSQADPSTSAMLSLIEQSTVRGADMVRQVLSFARGVDGQRVEVALDAVLDDVVAIARDTFPKDIRIQREPAIGVWPVLGDVTQVHQVVMNLCINARDAMPDGGTLRLGLENVTIDEHYAARDHTAAPGRYVLIRVEDDGVGMDQPTIDRLFEPFFTTKAHGEGTGLGLPTSRGIVASHGGFFQVYSEPGVGSSFKVYLPVAAVGERIADLSTWEEPLPRGDGQLVLLVDDEPATREVTRRTLETFGYRVLDAQDGTEAVPLLEEHRAEVDLLLTDMMMPNMDGPATIEAVLHRRPDLPVIAVSGLTASREVSRAADLGVTHFLPKPYPAATLLGTIQELLAAHDASRPGHAP